MSCDISSRNVPVIGNPAAFGTRSDAPEPFPEVEHASASGADIAAATAMADFFKKDLLFSI